MSPRLISCVNGLFSSKALRLASVALAMSVKASAGQKAHMRRHQNVAEGQQPGQGVVGQDVVGQVAVEDASLALVDVKADAADPAFLERRDQRIGVDQAAAAGVDQNDPGFHRGQTPGVDQVVIFGR